MAVQNNNIDRMKDGFAEMAKKQKLTVIFDR
jgi:hypothetical protein